MTTPLLTGSWFDLVHPNPWDAAYWTDTCRFWAAANWRALIGDMHACGLDTLVCGSTASWGRPLFPGYVSTVGLPLKMGCADPLAECMAEAEEHGMKVFLGIGFRGRCSQVRDYADMRPPWPDEWFTWNRALAEALVDRYGRRNSFGGLYIPYEIDFHNHQVDLYEMLINKYLRPVIGDVPLLASPGSLGDHPNLDQLPTQIKRMDLNILAPQDYGGRSRSVEGALELVRKHTAAIAKVGPKLRDIGCSLWTNCELFDLVPSPDGRTVCVPGPFVRIEQQIKLQMPHVDKLICYQYQGIMNRKTDDINIGGPGCEQLYRQYDSYRQSVALKIPRLAGENGTL